MPEIVSKTLEDFNYSLTQHDPHCPWSLIVLMESQFGHCSLESKNSGISSGFTTWILIGTSVRLSLRAPFRRLSCSIGVSSGKFLPAFHVVCFSLMDWMNSVVRKFAQDDESVAKKAINRTFFILVVSCVCVASA